MTVDKPHLPYTGEYKRAGELAQALIEKAERARELLQESMIDREVRLAEEKEQGTS